MPFILEVPELLESLVYSLFPVDKFLYLFYDFMLASEIFLLLALLHLIEIILFCPVFFKNSFYLVLELIIFWLVLINIASLLCKVEALLIKLDLCLFIEKFFDPGHIIINL